MLHAEKKPANCKCSFTNTTTKHKLLIYIYIYIYINNFKGNTATVSLLFFSSVDVKVYKLPVNPISAVCNYKPEEKLCVIVIKSDITTGVEK